MQEAKMIIHGKQKRSYLSPRNQLPITNTAKSLMTKCQRSEMTIESEVND